MSIETEAAGAESGLRLDVGRDEEPADDVGDWANAVIALLEDEIRSRP